MQGKIISMVIILISGFVLWFVPYCASGDILSTQQEIESLIEANKLTEAQTQIEQLKATYSRDPQLPEALYWIAHRYRLEHKWDQAINLYNQIIQDYPDSQSASRATLGIARVGVLSLLVAKDYDGAQQALDELLADFTGHPDLPETVYKIAEGFRWGHRWEQARSLYEQVKQDYPNTLYASRAELAIANLDVVSSLVAKNYADAKKYLDEMINNFPDHPDLPEDLYWIAEGYRWAHKWEQAKDLYQKIIKDYPESSYADRANVAKAKVEILKLIELRKFSLAENALNELITNFEGHPDLPEALFWIARQYEWESKYEEAYRIHKQVVSQYPGSTFADEARLGEARMEVGLLIYSGKTQEAQAAVEKLKTDFAGHSELADTLYEIAGMYDYKQSLEEAIELHSSVATDYTDKESGSQSSIQEARLVIIEMIDANELEAADAAVVQMETDFAGHKLLCEQLELIAEKYDQAGQFSNARAIYERIINNCSAETKVMIFARAGLDKYELSSAIESGDTGRIEAKVSGMGGYFAGDCQRLSEYLNTLAIRCYSEGRITRLAGDTNGKAINYFKADEMLLERVFTECPNSPLAPAACFSAAFLAARELNDYEKAIEYSLKTSDDWPDYEHAAWAQLDVADYFELMVQQGLIDAASAKPLIIAALEAVIEKYPGDGRARQAQSILEYYQQNEPGTRNLNEGCK